MTNHVGSNPEKERHLVNISVQHLGGKSQTIQHVIKHNHNKTLSILRGLQEDVKQ